MRRWEPSSPLVAEPAEYVLIKALGADRHVYASRSRFIPDALTSAFEVTSWPLANETAAPVGLVVDLAARMRGVWT